MAGKVPKSESGGGPDRDLPLADALGRVVERLLDVLRLQVREGVDDVGGRHAVSDHVDDGGHRDAETSNARESAHLGESVVRRSNFMAFWPPWQLSVPDSGRVAFT